MSLNYETRNFPTNTVCSVCVRVGVCVCAVYASAAVVRVSSRLCRSSGRPAQLQSMCNMRIGCTVQSYAVQPNMSVCVDLCVLKIYTPNC